MSRIFPISRRHFAITYQFIVVTLLILPFHVDAFHWPWSHKEPIVNTSGVVHTLPNGYKEVCFDEIDACFSNEWPWSSFGRLGLMPGTPQGVNARFFLYTRKNNEISQQLKANNVTALVTSNFDGSKPTKFIIHGFIDWGTNPWLKTMAQEFLKVEDANVFCVDWHGGSQATYGYAAANGRIVAAEIVYLVKFLARETGLRNENIHIVGHSLGAHIASYVGYSLKTLGRITGLDPADPYFQNLDPMVRLDETDAKYVDVIHTDAGPILKEIALQGGFGTWQPSGHVDVYANGGTVQPGCLEEGPITSIMKDGILEGGRMIFACAHCRAYKYMTESISSTCPWRSFKCPSWKEFQTGRCLHCSNDKTCNGVGYRTAKPADGSVSNQFWMATGDKPPFCRYHYHVKLTLARAYNDGYKGRLAFQLVSEKGASGWYQANDEAIWLRPSQTFDFLVTSPVDLGQNLTAVEVRWEKKPDRKPTTTTMEPMMQPVIYLSHVTVFSGEYQTAQSFCEYGSGGVEALSPKVLTTRC